MRSLSAVLVLVAAIVGVYLTTTDFDSGGEPERGVPALDRDGSEALASAADTEGASSGLGSHREDALPIVSDSEPALVPLRILLREEQRGVPIAGASAEVLRGSDSLTVGLTNSEGLVEFDPMFASSASRIRLEKDGFCAKSIPVPAIEDMVLDAARLLTIELKRCEVSRLTVVSSFDRQPVQGVSVFFRPTKPVLLGAPGSDSNSYPEEFRTPLDFRLVGGQASGSSRAPRRKPSEVDPLMAMMDSNRVVRRLPHQVRFDEPDERTPIGDEVLDHSLSLVLDGFHDLMLMKEGFEVVFLPEVEFPLLEPLEVVLESSDAMVRVEVDPPLYTNARHWPLQIAFERWLIHAEASDNGVFDPIVLGEGVECTVALSRLLPSGERIRFKARPSRARRDLVSDGRPIDVRFRVSPLRLRILEGLAVGKSLDEKVRFRAVGGDTQLDDDHVVARDEREFLLQIEEDATPRLVGVGERSGVWQSEAISRRADSVELYLSHAASYDLELQIDGVLGQTNWSLRPERIFEDPNLAIPSIASFTEMSGQGRPRTLNLSQAQSRMLERRGSFETSVGSAFLRLDRLVAGHYVLSVESRSSSGIRAVKRVHLAVPGGPDTGPLVKLKTEPTGIAYGRVPMFGHEIAFIRVQHEVRTQTIPVDADGGFEVELPEGKAQFWLLLPSDGLSRRTLVEDASFGRSLRRQNPGTVARIVADQRVEVPFDQAFLRLEQSGAFDAALSGLIAVTILGWTGSVDELELMLVRTAAPRGRGSSADEAIAASSRLLPIRERGPTIVRGLEPAATYSVVVRSGERGDVLGWADVPVDRVSREVLVSVAPVRNLQVFTDYEPGVYLVPVGPQKRRIQGASIEPVSVANGTSTFSVFPPGAYYVVRHGRHFESLSSREQIPFDFFNDDMTLDLRGL
ncbi:MAG: hypothetical protein AAF196_16900 [Planctomycetota bacterium]